MLQRGEGACELHQRFCDVSVQRGEWFHRLKAIVEDIDPAPVLVASRAGRLVCCCFAFQCVYHHVLTRCVCVCLLQYADIHMTGVEGLLQPNAKEAMKWYARHQSVEPFAAFKLARIYHQGVLVGKVR